jgi:galactokinase
LDFLVKLAQSTKGVLGARMTGAGFGGCTVNLVEKHLVKNFIECINVHYPEKFAIKPGVYELDSNMEVRVLIH